MGVNKNSLGLLLFGILLVLGGGYLIYYWLPDFINFVKGGIGLVILLIGALFALIGGSDLKE